MKCKMCPKELPKVARLAGDLFCSNQCARKFYGTQLKGTSTHPQKPATPNQRPAKLGRKGYPSSRDY